MKQWKIRFDKVIEAETEEQAKIKLDNMIKIGEYIFHKTEERALNVILKLDLDKPLEPQDIANLIKEGK